MSPQGNVWSIDRQGKTIFNNRKISRNIMILEKKYITLRSIVRLNTNRKTEITREKILCHKKDNVKDNMLKYYIEFYNLSGTWQPGSTFFINSYI